MLGQDVKPLIGVTDASGRPVVGVESHLFRNGGVTLITLLSNPLQRVDELGPPDFKSNKRFETPVPVTLRLPVAAYLYNARTGEALGQQRTLAVTVMPYEPLILVSTPSPFPAMAVSAPNAVQRGSNINVGIAMEGTPAETHVIHIDVLDPKGARMLQYSGNLLAGQGSVAKHIPLALNDPTGDWTVRIHDVMSGQTETRTINVN